MPGPELQHPRTCAGGRGHVQPKLPCLRAAVASKAHHVVHAAAPTLQSSRTDSSAALVSLRLHCTCSRLHDAHQEQGVVLRGCDATTQWRVGQGRRSARTGTGAEGSGWVKLQPSRGPVTLSTPQLGRADVISRCRRRLQGAGTQSIGSWGAMCHAYSCVQPPDLECRLALDLDVRDCDITTSPMAAHREPSAVHQPCTGCMSGFTQMHAGSGTWTEAEQGSCLLRRSCQWTRCRLQPPTRPQSAAAGWTAAAAAAAGAAAGL